MPTSPATRQREKFLVFGAPDIQEAEIAEVVASLRSGWLGTGPKVHRFEEAFGAYKGAPHAVAVNSCTAALHLSLLAAGLKKDDEVITTALTFCATVNAILHAGARPVLVDVDPRTLNLDPAALARAITPHTRAIVPVHFAGNPCDMEAVCALAQRHELRLIEDCAHAIESESRGRKTGTFGDFGCFSFYVTKNLAAGEGGMILARRAEDAARLKTLALHGLSQDAWARFGDQGYKHYQVVELGFKYNMMDLQAAIGLHQLARLERAWLRRREIWRRYDEAFAGLPLELPPHAAPGDRHAFHLYTIRLDPRRCGVERDEFLARMTARKIGVGVHYLSIAEHPYYQRRFGWRPESWPEARRIGRQTISLPIGPRLADEDVEDVIDAVRSSLAD